MTVYSPEVCVIHGFPPSRKKHISATSQDGNKELYCPQYLAKQIARKTEDCKIGPKAVPRQFNTAVSSKSSNISALI